MATLASAATLMPEHSVTSARLAGRAGMSAESTADMAEDLVEDLEAMGRLPEAATLARDYLKDAERAVLLLIRVCTP